MSLKLEKMHQAAAKRERIPEGTYPSRIYSVVDLGVQPMTDWQTGEPAPSKERLLITWELPTELIEIVRDDGESEMAPRLISKEYTQSQDKRANLVILMEAIAPLAGGADELIDLPCLISVGSTKTGNAKITNCIKAPKGMEVDELSRPGVAFDFDAPDEEAFLALPGWVRQKIVDAENYTGFADGWGVEEAA